jgi:hypothetical protein
VSELPRHLNGRSLVGRYHELKSEERFRLATAAGARGDEREFERLVSTCPTVRYRMADPAYLDRVEASRDLAVAVALELAPRLAQVRMLDTVRELLLESQLAVVRLAAEVDGEKVDDDELLARAGDWSFLDALATAGGQLRSGVAPRWPNRSAAQISAGNTRYVSGRSPDSASALSATTAAIIASDTARAARAAVAASLRKRSGSSGSCSRDTQQPLQHPCVVLERPAKHSERTLCNNDGGAVEAARRQLAFASCRFQPGPERGFAREVVSQAGRNGRRGLGGRLQRDDLCGV